MTDCTRCETVEGKMKEIKFRVLDMDTGKVYQSEEIRRIGFEKGMPFYVVLTYGNVVTNFKLMQFTGLHDKNGMEIYEGDIVVKDEYMWFDGGKPNYVGTVEWIYSQWQVVAHCVNSDKRGVSDGVNQGLNDEGFEEGEKSDWRVIGNLYQIVTGEIREGPMPNYIFSGETLDGKTVEGDLVHDGQDRTYILMDVMDHINRDDYAVYMVEVRPSSVRLNSTRMIY